MPAVTTLPRLLGLAAVVSAAVLARLVYGPAHVGYDAAWSLVWGRSLSRGELPDYEAPVAPTPHPLSNVGSTVVALLGPDTAITATLALSWLAFGALIYACFALGRALFGRPVGVVAAAVVGTRTIFVNETLQALVDIPFLALVVGAAVLVARDAEGSRTGLTVPVLLLAAGLLRPEGWLVAAAWVVWARPPVRAVVIAAAAPLAWAVFDLAVTGDPLHSLHGTRDLAAELDRPREADTALAAAPAYLRRALDDAVLWIGIAGAAAGLVWHYERSLLPGALLVLGLVTFLALGVAGLPLLVRYMLLPAVMLALFFGVALLGWTALPAGDSRRLPWQIAAGVAVIVVGVGVPNQVDRLRGGIDFAAERRTIQNDLQRLAAVGRVQAAVRDCAPPSLPDHRPRPMLAWWLDIAPGRLRSGPPPATATRATALTYASLETADVFTVSTSTPEPAVAVDVPPAFRVIAENTSWRFSERCARGSA